MYFFFFFLMIRRPPRSTLFPTRRSSDLSGRNIECVGEAVVALKIHLDAKILGKIINERSEEHTSELQSQSNLVCRLLLEKKKNNIQQIYQNYSPALTPLCKYTTSLLLTS